MTEDELRKYLAKVAAHGTDVLGVEDIVATFVKLGDAGEPLPLVRAHFADRPNYGVELRPIDDWLSVFDVDQQQFYVLAESDVGTIDAALRTVVGGDLRSFECILTSTKKDDPFLRPHYGVWWADFVFVGSNGTFLLHFARTD